METAGIKSPFKIGVAPKPRLAQGDVSSQIRDKQEQEEIAKKTGIMPYPMEHVNPILSDVFSNLVNIKGLVKQASNNPDVDKEAFKRADKLLDKMCKAILDLPLILGSEEI